MRSSDSALLQIDQLQASHPGNLQDLFEGSLMAAVVIWLRLAIVTWLLFSVALLVQEAWLLTATKLNGHITEQLICSPLSGDTVSHLPLLHSALLMSMHSSRLTPSCVIGRNAVSAAVCTAGISRHRQACPSDIYQQQLIICFISA